MAVTLGPYTIHMGKASTIDGLGALMRLDSGKTATNKSLMLDRMTSQELSFELETGWSGVLPLVYLFFFLSWPACQRITKQPPLSPT